MTEKIFLNSIFGIISMAGLVLLMCCDTDAAGLLFFIVLAGIVLLVLGGWGLIINNRERE